MLAYKRTRIWQKEALPSNGYPHLITHHFTPLHLYQFNFLALNHTEALNLETQRWRLLIADFVVSNKVALRSHHNHLGTC
jgi:hypothetical protein